MRIKTQESFDLQFERKMINMFDSEISIELEKRRVIQQNLRKSTYDSMIQLNSRLQYIL